MHPLIPAGMTTILLTTSNYLPGYKAGGPVRSLANLVDRLGEEFAFRILTADRDLGDHQPYPGVETGFWKPVGKAQVMYLSPRQMGLMAWHKLLNQIDFDLIYLNSFLATQKCIYAPAMLLGNASCSANYISTARRVFSWCIGPQAFEKAVCISLLHHRLASLDKLIWQATNEHEKQEMLTALGVYVNDIVLRIVSVPNLASVQSPRETVALYSSQTPWRYPYCLPLSNCAHEESELRLDLTQWPEGTVEFDIYGPAEDQVFWRGVPADCT